MGFQKKSTTSGTHSPRTQGDGTNVSNVDKTEPTASTITLEGVVRRVELARLMVASLTQSPSAITHVTYRDMELIKEIANGSRELMNTLDNLFEKMAIALLQKMKNS